MSAQFDDIICLSLSEDTFKAVQIKRGKLVEVAAIDIKGVGDSELARTIQPSLKKFTSKTALIVNVIPAGMTTTKNIEIPSTNAEEIKSIVNLQASRHTPFSREEIQIGYINTGVYKSNYTKVLLVIANRNVIKRNLTVFEKAGLKIRYVLFAPEGIAKFYTDALNAQGVNIPAAIIDIGKTSTDFTIINNGVAISSRGIPIGSHHLATEGTVARGKLTDELSKTIDSYKAEDIDQLPSRFILTTQDEHTKDLAAVLKEKFKWNTEINPYLDYVNPAGGVLESLVQEYPEQSFLDVIAAGSVAGEAQVNLIPEEIQLQKTVEDQGQEILRTVMLGFVILIVIAVAFGMKMYFTNAFLTKLKDTNSSNDKRVTELKGQFLKTNLIERFLSERTVSLDVINELYRNIPNEIYLTSLLMDEKGNISLQGISDVPSLVFNLGSSLKESTLFKSVEIKSTTAKKDRGKDVSSFEISLKLKSALEEAKASDKDKAEAKK